MVQFINYGEQSRRDALAWVKGVKLVSDEAAAAYGAGHAAGWRDAISALTLHGVIVSDGK